MRIARHGQLPTSGGRLAPPDPFETLNVSVHSEKAVIQPNEVGALVRQIQQCAAQVVIPPKQNRKQQRAYDRHRNLVERLFCRMKHFGRIATRYDKLAGPISAFIVIVACFIWLT